MYRRPKFLTVLIRIREIMSREADYDVDLFAEMVRSGQRRAHGPERTIRGFKKRSRQTDFSENDSPDSENQRIAL